ncbi:MAG: response regulator transcription factor [Lachnospiraceae bacterium]|nr:response regulator transcription factor [Lachnospiraceae bacterium]
MIRVLIVDDEYIMRQGLKYMINWEHEGYEIVGEATNGNEALKLLDRLQPHIIICDIVMPLLDGVDFAEAVHKMYPQMQIIILSGYDNFEYVKRTLMSGVVDYILKPTLNQEELKKILRKAVERIPGYKLHADVGMVSYERILERYLHGHDVDLAECAHYFTRVCFSIYAVNIKKESAAGKDMFDVLYQKIERELEKISDVQKVSLLLREELVCVIFCYDSFYQEKLVQAVREMNNQLVMLCDSVFGVYSSTFRKLDLLKDVYSQEILKHVDKAFYHEGRHLLLLDKQKTDLTLNTPEKFDFYRYNQLLLGKQYQEAARFLLQYNVTALEAQMDVYGLKNQMKNMVYHFLDLLQISDEDKDDLRFQFFGEIERAMYEMDYRRCISQIMERMLELSGSVKMQGDERITQMLVYISQNYQEDLKLEDLAEEFNFNYHYLSAYFNQQMKEGFSDYLNRLRIEKACQLLKESSLSISMISGEVGYSEHSYFCRVFKKIVGKTPSEYRRSRYYE